MIKSNSFSSVECWSASNSYSGCFLSFRKCSANWNKNGCTRTNYVSFGWNKSFSRSLDWSRGI